MYLFIHLFILFICLFIYLFINLQIVEIVKIFTDSARLRVGASYISVSEGRFLSFTKDYIHC